MLILPLHVIIFVYAICSFDYFSVIRTMPRMDFENNKNCYFKIFLQWTPLAVLLPIPAIIMFDKSNNSTYIELTVFVTVLSFTETLKKSVLTQQCSM